MPLVVPPKLRRRVQRRRGRPPLRVLRSGAIPGSVTFPTTNLVFRVMVALGADLTQAATWWQWNWVDITEYVRYDLGISIRAGKPSGDESTRVTPSSCTLKLDNSAKAGTTYPAAGRFTRRNPASPFYGLLSKNTPIWVQVDPGSGFRTVYQGYVTEWPVRWSDKSATDSTVTIQCAGLLRRLGQGGAPLRSPQHRFHLRHLPAAWWPLDDPAGATNATPAAGTAKLNADLIFATSTAEFGAGELASWLPSGLAVHGVVNYSGRVAPGPVPTTLTADLYRRGRVSPDPVGGGDPAALLLIQNAATAAGAKIAYAIQWVYTGGANTLKITRISDIATAVDTASADDAAAGFDNQFHHWRLTATQNGSNVDLTAYIDGELVMSGTHTSATLTRPVHVGLTAWDLDVAYLHLALWCDNTPPIADAYSAALSHAGEAACARIVRLFAEEGVQLTYRGDIAAGPAMGPQSDGKFLNLVRDAENVDSGLIYEDGFACGYLGRWERENTAVAMTCDFNSSHIAELPTPADDDKFTRNRCTATRRTGTAEYAHEVTTGPMGTGPEGPGLYEESITVNVHTDDQLIPQASYRTMLGTLDEDRWPRVELNLARTPELVETFAAMGFGARINLVNPPPEMPPDTIDLTVEGVSQRLDPRAWRVVLYAVPFEPNRTFRTVGDSGDTDDFPGYQLPDWCVTCEALDTTETEILFFSEPRFSTDADDWTPPVALRIGGEEIALSAAAVVASDAYGRTETDTWGVATTGQTWITNQTAADWDVTTTPFGHGTVSITTLASDYLAIFDVAHPDVDLVATFRLETLPASGEYRFGLSGRSTLATTGGDASFYHGEAQINSAGQITLRLRKRVQGTQSNLASRVVGTLTAGSAYRLRFAAVGTTLTIKLWAGDVSADGDEPRWWLLSFTDESLDGVTLGGTYAGVFARNDTAATTHVLSVDDYAVLRPQLATVARSQNTVVKSHPTATPFEFAHPGVLGL